MNQDLEQSFVTQLKENQNIIHKICRLYTSGEDAHKDLFQEMVIQLWKAYPTFKGQSKFTTWAYRVSLNTAISLYRVKKRRVETVTWDYTVHNIQYEEYSSEEEDKLNYLYAAVQELNDIEKALVFMYLEDKDYAEIAETLGVSEVNARVRMNRIKTKLKVILSQRGAL